MTADKLLLKIL